ncbi:hypothetical protein [Kitasatospora herbaricolor]|uniref:hypothetical protein n=1 Tax=Kitasatospora herbaricolor TaxID=68217 RepID=UPI0036DC5BB4
MKSVELPGSVMTGGPPLRVRRATAPPFRWAHEAAGGEHPERRQHMCSDPYPWHAEIFVLAGSGERVRVGCDCPKQLDHDFEDDTAENVSYEFGRADRRHVRLPVR